MTLENESYDIHADPLFKERILWNDFFSLKEDKEDREEIERIKKKMPLSQSSHSIDEEAEKLFFEQEKTRLDKQEYSGVLTEPKVRETIKKRMREIIDSAEKKGIQEMVFLDKGARTWGYLFRKAWDILEPGKEKPQISFINIGREKTKSLDYGNAWHLQNDLLKTFGDKFENKKICIFDEYMETGKSLLLATVLFEKTYPSSKVFSEWFSSDSLDKSYLAKIEKDISRLTDTPPPDMSSFINSFYSDSKGVVENVEDPYSIRADSWSKSTRIGSYERELQRKVMPYRRMQLKKLAYEFLDEKN